MCGPRPSDRPWLPQGRVSRKGGGTRASLETRLSDRPWPPKGRVSRKGGVSLAFRVACCVAFCVAFCVKPEGPIGILGCWGFRSDHGLLGAAQAAATFAGDGSILLSRRPGCCRGVRRVPSRGRRSLLRRAGCRTAELLTPCFQKRAWRKKNIGSIFAAPGDAFAHHPARRRCGCEETPGTHCAVRCRRVGRILAASRASHTGHGRRQQRTDDAK